MAKLTDLQLVILSSAAKRESGAVLPLPKSIKAKPAAVSKDLRTLLARKLVEETPARRGAPSWREQNGQRIGLAITQAGLDALELGNASAPKRARKSGTKGKGTKSERIIEMLRKAQGASIAELQKATGWQAHSIRGALSTFRKSGTAIRLCRHDDGPSTYHVDRGA